MIAFLLPAVLICMTLLSGIALIDSALRWVSAYRRLYPSAKAAYGPQDRMRDRPCHIRHTVAFPARPVVKPSKRMRAAA